MRINTINLNYRPDFERFEAVVKVARSSNSVRSHEFVNNANLDKNLT